MALRRFIYCLFGLAFFYSTSARAQPGADKLLEEVLSHVDGFSVWGSNTNYSGEIPGITGIMNHDSISSPYGGGQPRYAFSLKYHLKQFWQRISNSQETGRTFDTTYTGSVGLNWGYSYSSPVLLRAMHLGGVHDTFTTTFPYSGFFGSAVFGWSIRDLWATVHWFPGDMIGVLRPLDDLRLAVGVQANFYNLSTISATYSSGDTSIGQVAVQMNSPLIVSPEVFSSITLPLGNGITPFVDYDVQFLNFSGLYYSPASQSNAEKYNRAASNFPRLINLDNWQVKIGVSITKPVDVAK